jgi:hypothetical protein
MENKPRLHRHFNKVNLTFLEKKIIYQPKHKKWMKQVQTECFLQQIKPCGWLDMHLQHLYEWKSQTQTDI